MPWYHYVYFYLYWWGKRWWSLEILYLEYEMSFITWWMLEDLDWHIRSAEILILTISKSTRRTLEEIALHSLFKVRAKPWKQIFWDKYKSGEASSLFANSLLHREFTVYCVRSKILYTVIKIKYGLVKDRRVYIYPISGQMRRLQICRSKHRTTAWSSKA